MTKTGEDFFFSLFGVSDFGFVCNLEFVIWDFSFFSASMVALALFNLFVVLPKILAVKFLTPARLATTRTAPPAIKPLPSLDGLSNTFAAANFPKE